VVGEGFANANLFELQHIVADPEEAVGVLLLKSPAA
jgi:hypothetical protein